MDLIPEEERRFFHGCYDSDSWDFVKSWLERCTFVERAQDRRFPSMVAGIVVENIRLDSFLSEYRRSERKVEVVSHPEFSHRTALVISKKNIVYKGVVFREFFRVKRECFDKDFKKVLKCADHRDWGRRGRRPRRGWVEGLRIGFFACFYPYSVREVYLLLSLPTIREMYEIKVPPGYTEVWRLRRRVQELLPNLSQVL